MLDTGSRWFPTSWSPDGRVLALYSVGPTNTRDLSLLRMDDGNRAPTPFVATPFEERGAIFSPSGRWLAYMSNKTGQDEVFAHPYPHPAPK